MIHNEKVLSNRLYARSQESIELENLVKRAAEGDLHAQQALFVKYWPLIQQIARAFRYRQDPALRRACETQDFFQEVALQILKSLPNQRWQGRQAFKAWLKKLAAAKQIDLNRYALAKQRDYRKNADFDHNTQASQFRRSPESKVFEKVRMQTLCNLLTQLKPSYAGAISLYYLGYTYLEIGDILGCSREAARKLLARGQAKLLALKIALNS